MKDRGTRSRDDDWDADWDGHRRWQLTAGLGATPAQRPAWLEDAIQLAHASGALAARGSQRDSPDHDGR